MRANRPLSPSRKRRSFSGPAAQPDGAESEWTDVETRVGATLRVLIAWGLLGAPGPGGTGLGRGRLRGPSCGQSPGLAGVAGGRTPAGANFPLPPVLSGRGDESRLAAGTRIPAPRTAQVSPTHLLPPGGCLQSGTLRGLQGAEVVETDSQLLEGRAHRQAGLPPAIRAPEGLAGFLLEASWGWGNSQMAPKRPPA